MASQVQICNMALSRLGASTITSLTDNTTEAKLCNTLFDDLADRAMIQGSWSSTITRTSLAQTTNTPSFEYANEFQLPVDPLCLKVLNIDEDTPGQTEYRIERDKLLTDSASIKIRYIAQLTDTEDYDPLLTEAVEILLASYLALPITGDARLAERLRQEYFELVSHNLAIDGQQGSKAVVSSTDLTDIR
jgi:hypothetical protein